MHIYSRIQDAIIEHFNVFIQLSPCFLMHDGCVKRAVSTGWVASCHTSRPSSEGRATSFSWVHKRNGNMFVISESSALFVFFVNCAKKKHPTRPAYLPAIAHVFWRFFISFEVFRQMENAGVTLSSDWWAAFTLGPGIFGRWFSLPKKWGSLPFGVETNHQFTYPKTKVDFMYFWP